jgi:hypothetical protein
MSPKLVPAGVFTESVVPLKVIVVVPLMFVKFTTFVPLTLKTPVVLNVTGSACATAAVNAKTTAPNSGIKTLLKLMSISFVLVVWESETQLQYRNWHSTLLESSSPHQTSARGIRTGIHNPILACISSDFA